jgi:SpoVK/Ycf46/Vps4 family AAA+-type ATPase
MSGDSETNMLSALSQLDHEEPCLALFDEVEKVFATSHHDTSGVTPTLLSQLLWWLAGRQSRVLAVISPRSGAATDDEAPEALRPRGGGGGMSLSTFPAWR